MDNQPIIPGTGLVVYLDGTAQTLGSNYTVNNDTGVITFTSAPASGVRVDATYTHYTISTIKFAIANAAGGRPVDITQGETVIGYSDTDTLQNNITNYTIAKLGNADSDNLLEQGEVFEITVTVSAYGLTDGDEFTIEVQAQQGAVVRLGRVIPARINAVMRLG